MHCVKHEVARRHHSYEAFNFEPVFAHFNDTQMKSGSGLHLSVVFGNSGLWYFYSTPIIHVAPAALKHNNIVCFAVTNVNRAWGSTPGRTILSTYIMVAGELNFHNQRNSCVILVEKSMHELNTLFNDSLSSNNTVLPQNFHGIFKVGVVSLAVKRCTTLSHPSSQAPTKHLILIPSPTKICV